MKAIRLYQIPFSHFCDKVRWALDYFALPYEPIVYSPRGSPGLKNAPPSLQKLVPIIEDANNNSLFVADSTPILRYLDERYGQQKTLFPTDADASKERITQYCLRLDSELGPYARRLAYLHVISEKPAILSVLLDGNFEKTSCDDWKSYALGLLGSCIIIGRFGVHQIQEEQIFEKTARLLDEIQRDLRDKEFLFNNQFTAADLTLTALIQPLRGINSLHTKYSPVFAYCDQIRERYDPKRPKESLPVRLLNEHRQNWRPSPVRTAVRTFIWYLTYVVFYPFKLLFVSNGTKSERRYQYPSADVTTRADNDNRKLKFNSVFSSIVFFSTNLWHLCFTLPKQMEHVNQQGEQLLGTRSHPKRL